MAIDQLKFSKFVYKIFPPITPHWQFVLANKLPVYKEFLFKTN